MYLPAKMMVIEILEPGSAKNLTPAERPLPEPSAGQVLIKVAAAGINRPDIMQRKGLYPPPPGASDIPGLEIAGTIVAVADGATKFKIGDNVCALINGGGYAQYSLADADLCLPIPNGLTPIQAAGIPETFFTVWSNLFDRAKLRAKETLLIHGGTSGIGTTAIQIAKVFGCRVYTTAGNEQKCQFCLDLGADAAINYQQQDFVDEINKLTQNQGVDVILDIIGGDYFPRNLQCMADDARLVQIAIQHGPKTEMNLLSVMRKRLTITGSTLRTRSVAFKADIAGKLHKKVWPLLETGRIKPVICRTFPLREASKAHELMESSQHLGKIILTVQKQ